MTLLYKEHSVTSMLLKCFKPDLNTLQPVNIRSSYTKTRTLEPFRNSIAYIMDPWESQRADLKFKDGMEACDASLRRVWAPLNLDDLQNKHDAEDRDIILDQIRQVYDPILQQYLADPKHVWKNLFSSTERTYLLESRLSGLQDSMPMSAQFIPNGSIGVFLYDVLRYYRFTNPSWQKPLPKPAPEVVGPPHPQAPNVLPFISINSNWIVSNPVPVSLVPGAPPALVPPKTKVRRKLNVFPKPKVLPKPQESPQPVVNGMKENEFGIFWCPGSSDQVYTVLL